MLGEERWKDVCARVTFTRVVKLSLWGGANASGYCDLNDPNKCLCLQILLAYPSLQALVFFM